MRSRSNIDEIRAIILADGRNFRRCLPVIRLPMVLWPVAGRPVLEHLLVSLADQGMKQATICSHDDCSLLRRSINADSRLQVEFLDEPLPVGTAGCIREAAKVFGEAQDGGFLVIPANSICPPEVDSLVKAHQKGQSEFTIFLNPVCRNGRAGREPANIYVCGASVVKHIPEDGYCDIKEGLIPELLKAGKSVHSVTLPQHTGYFCSRQQYLAGIADYLEEGKNIDSRLELVKKTASQALWTAKEVKIDPTARIYGPVVVLDGAEIGRNAVVFGPGVIGRNVCVGNDSLLSNSVVWDGAAIGSNCEVHRCVIDHNVMVQSHASVEDESVAYRHESILKKASRRIFGPVLTGLETSRWAFSGLVPRIINRVFPSMRQFRNRKIAACSAGILVLIAFLWCYWPNVLDLWNAWRRSDEYSSGLLVPFLAVYILWSRRHRLAQCLIRPCVWGVLVFIAAQTMRLFGLFFLYGSAERLSIALSIAALVLLLFGWQLFRKVSTVLLFLCLMLPWPNRVQAAVALPLQRWATSSAVFCLETVGYEVVQEGNVIHIGEASVAVAEACNGLRMITAFLVISGLVVLLVKRAWWEKLIVLASSLPIALLCNTTRLAVTAVAFTVVSGEHWERMFHDFGGYAMMPLALAAVVAEFWLLANLTTVPTKEEPIIIARQRP